MTDELPARGLGQILSDAFRIYRENAAQLLLLVAVVVVPLTLIGWLLRDVVFDPGTTEEIIGDEVVRVPESRTFFVFLLVVLIGAAISVIITAIVQAATLRAAAQATIGDPVDVTASYRFGLRRFGSVLLVSILVGLIVAIGFILLIIPGIIFLVFLSVSIPAVVVENRRGREAMKRSWNLVKGHWWHVFGVVVVAAIITGIVSGLISAIGGSNDALRVIFSMVGSIIVAPYSALVTVLLYLDLRARVESLTASGLRAEMGAGG